MTEIGSIVSLGAKESCEFFHDPFKGKRCHAIHFVYDSTPLVHFMMMNGSLNSLMIIYLYVIDNVTWVLHILSSYIE